MTVYRNAFPRLARTAAMIAVALVLLAALAQAAPPRSSSPGPPALAGSELSLDAVVHEALEVSPSVAAVRHRATAATHVPRRVRSLPDPTARTGFYGVPLDALDPFDGELRLQLRQELPYPGTLERRGRVAERDAERLEHTIGASRVRVAAEARRAYWELYFAHRAREIHHRHLTLVRELSSSAEELYATGQVPQENVLRALVELTELFAELSRVDAGIGAAAARLNGILHRPPDASLGTPRPPSADAVAEPLELARLLDLAEGSNPRLAAARSTVSREEARVEMERHEGKPDLGVTGEWWTQPDGMGGRSERYAVLVTLSLPWFHDAKYEAAVDEAMATRSAAESERLALRDEVRSRVAAALERLRAAERIAELYRTSVLPQSEQALEAARAAYEAGSAGFVTVVDNERTLLANRLALARAEADIGAARADLLEAVGVVNLEAGTSGSSPGGPAADAPARPASFGTLAGSSPGDGPTARRRQRGSLR